MACSCSPVCDNFSLDKINYHWFIKGKEKNEDIPLYKIIRKENLPPLMLCQKPILLEPRWFRLPIRLVERLHRRKQGRLSIYDSNSLYALYVCEETLPLAVYRKHDEPLYEENVVELFIDTLGTGKVYYELE